MNDRQKNILERILSNEYISFSSLIEELGISKRTLYYDIERINYEIRDFGEVIKYQDSLIYSGKKEIIDSYKVELKTMQTRVERQNKILEKLFLGTFSSIDNESILFDVSKNTIANDIESLKSILKRDDIKIEYDKKYQIKGNELNIRMHFIKLMYFDDKILSNLDPRIMRLNNEANLFLTDYSIAFLSKFIKFNELRIKDNYKLNYNQYDKIIKNIDYYDNVRKIFNYQDESEILFLVSYIASLTKLRSQEIKEQVDHYIDELIKNFEDIAVINIDNKEEFKREFRRHIQSSYYRILFNFPPYNPSLNDIKTKYKYLFQLVSESVQKTSPKIFKNMREEELGFITMYFGSRVETVNMKKNRVIIVCPNGLMVSKIIEDQLRNYIPTLDIKGMFSIHDLEKIDIDFEYIISTVPIENKNNVILVNPILTENDINNLKSKFLGIRNSKNLDMIKELLEIIKNNGIIYDVSKLEKELVDYMFGNINGRKEQKMLSELLTRDKIRKIEKVDTWEDGIIEASKVLLDQGLIEKSYIEAMIESVNQNGPYIVLEDGFALPHASRTSGVNELSMSLLSLDKEVDMMGKPVKVIMVLAAKDDASHLRALSSLSDILGEEENMDILMSGDLSKIEKLIIENSK